MRYDYKHNFEEEPTLWDYFKRVGFMIYAVLATVLITWGVTVLMFTI